MFLDDSIKKSVQLYAFLCILFQHFHIAILKKTRDTSLKQDFNQHSVPTLCDIVRRFFRPLKKFIYSDFF